ncbi:glycoside hydrolase family 30 beta sandwich domain-containing protein [Flavobacterium sp. 3HN19-14]|uniref:glycoside hydrolase family 30 beta sandwich domain-containing protein n=1 Tax=Flavobacterium sp. 3HN19-14 TaxID=3448133 RepID=UPI003EE2E092
MTRNPAYYVIGHASKFVSSGSLRIASNAIENLPNVAFKRPDGKIVLIVLNSGKKTSDFNIRCNGKNLAARLDSGSVATFVW